MLFLEVEMWAVDKLPNGLKDRINNVLSSMNEIVRQIFIIISTICAITWLSVFLYGSFYFYYVPVVTQERPVYFHFRVCDTGVGMCSFPTANISLLKEGKNEVFNMGQSYKIVVDLDVPESDVNRQIGMFMIEMRLYNKHGEVVQRSARAVSTVLQYKSDLLRILETMAFAPFFLFGYMNQKQFLHVELFPDFMDNTYNPSVGIVIEVQSMKAEIYTAQLRIFAQFSGIRYFLYYWPVTSAVVGISWNFFVISFIVLLSWYQFWLPRQQDDDVSRIRINLFRNRKTPAAKKKYKEKLDKPVETLRSDDSGNDENTSLLTPAPSSSREEEGLRLRQPYSASSS